MWYNIYTIQYNVLIQSEYLGCILKRHISSVCVGTSEIALNIERYTAEFAWAMVIDNV